MNQFFAMIAAIALIGLSLPGYAQSEFSDEDRERLEHEMESAAEEMERARAELERARSEMEFNRADIEKELAAARAEMEEAAREMARLGQEMAGEFAIRFGDLERGAMLGINLGNDSDQGIEVVAVTPGGPADEAGVKTGDVLVSIDGQALDQVEGSATMYLIEHMATVEPDQQVSLGVTHDGQYRDVVVTATESQFARFAFQFPDPENFDPKQFEFEEFQFVFPDRVFGGHAVIAGWGEMELVSLTPGLGRYFGTDKGLLVVRAPHGDTLQLRDGDVILRIGDKVPESPGDALRILASYKAGAQVEIEIMREQRPVRLDVALPERPAEAYQWEPVVPDIDAEISVEPDVST